MFSKYLKHLFYDGFVFFQMVGEDQDVIQVNNNVSCYDFISQDVVHEGLEGGR